MNRRLFKIITSCVFILNLLAVIFMIVSVFIANVIVSYMGNFQLILLISIIALDIVYIVCASIFKMLGRKK